MQNSIPYGGEGCQILAQEGQKRRGGRETQLLFSPTTPRETWLHDLGTICQILELRLILDFYTKPTLD